MEETLTAAATNGIRKPQPKTDPRTRALNTRTATVPLWALLIPLLLLVTWLGVRGLNADALWYDEWLSVFYAGGGDYGPLSLAEIWARVAERSTWPPGFQTLLGGWGALVGWHHLSTRVLTLLAGLLAVAWTYRLGRDLKSPLVGISAAVLLGGSALFVNYLHELRGYSLAVLFTAMCMWAYWRYSEQNGGRWALVWLFVSVVGLLYTHYFAALTIVVVGLVHLARVVQQIMARRQDRRFWRRWFIVTAVLLLAGLTFLPWAGVLLGTAEYYATEDGNRGGRAMSLMQTVEVLIYTFSSGGVALLALIGVYAVPTLRDRIGRLAWFWLLFLLLTLLLVNEWVKVIFHIRHLLGLWVPLALVGALGVERLARGRSGTSGGIRPVYVLTIWLAAGVVTSFNPAFINNLPPNRPPIIPWGGFSATLDALALRGQENDLAAFHVHVPGKEWLTQPIIDYYMTDLPLRHTQLEEIPGFAEDGAYAFQAREVIDDAPFVWLAIMPDVPSPYHVAEFRRALSADHVHCGRVSDHPQMTLDLYTDKPVYPQDTPFRFGEETFPDDDHAIHLRLLHSVHTDATYHALTWWTIDETVPRDVYSVSLFVLDSDETVVVQEDFGLPREQYACHSTDLDIADLPAGDYAVAATVYRWQDGVRLTGEHRREDFLTDVVPIATFHKP